MFLTDVVRGNILAHSNAPETFAKMQTPTLWGLDVQDQIIVRHDGDDRGKTHRVGMGDKNEDRRARGGITGQLQGFDRA